MAFLDHLTKGRAILGVGPCALVTDKNLFGLATGKLYPMMAESVESSYACSNRPSRSTTTVSTGRSIKCACSSFLPTAAHALAIASSGNPVSLELAGKYGMLFLSPAGKNKRNNQTKAEQWNAVEGIASRPRRANFARQLAHRNLRVSRRQPRRSVARRRRDVGRDMEYFFAIGLKAPYERTLDSRRKKSRRAPAPTGATDYRHTGRRNRADRTHAGGNRRFRRAYVDHT